jgi:hypothetical protein
VIKSTSNAQWERRTKEVTQNHISVRTMEQKLNKMKEHDKKSSHDGADNDGNDDNNENDIHVIYDSKIWI